MKNIHESAGKQILDIIKSIIDKHKVNKPYYLIYIFFRIDLLKNLE